MVNLINTKEVVITTKRKYASQNVYDALQNRFHFIFKEFDNIFVSFSGGKDSGLLLNLTLDFQKKFYPNKKIGVFHQDFEAQYSATTDYVERTFTRIEKDVEPFFGIIPRVPEHLVVAERCSCCHGMIPKKLHGYVLCQTIPM